MVFSGQLTLEIEESFQKLLPEIGEQKEQLLKKLLQVNEEQSLLIKFLYSSMPFNDLADYDFSLFLEFANHALFLRKNLEWCKKIPERIFLSDVVHYRINSENIMDCRKYFYEILHPRIQGKTMKEAVLEINYWCAENVLYKASNFRTAAPITVYLSGTGRCGEESTFAVTALRSVGIPARQVYTPRWAHCDDNHAWVEVWCEGEWYFLGACEPEEALNIGWFTNAASRALLIHSRNFSSFDQENMISKEGLLTYVGHTGLYAKTKEVEIKVINSMGQPIKGAMVKFQILNSAEYVDAATHYTDPNGSAKITIGVGDIKVHVVKEDKFTERILGAEEDQLIISLEDNPAEKDRWLEYTIKAPAEFMMHPVKLTPEQKDENKRRLEQCERLRNQKLEKYYNETLTDRQVVVRDVIKEVKDDLKETKDELQEIKNILQEDREALQEVEDILEEEKKILKEEKNILKEEKIILQEDRETLQEVEDILEDEKNILKEAKDILKEEMDIFQEEKDILREVEDILEDEKNILKEAKDFLKEEMDIFQEEKDILQEAEDILKAARGNLYEVYQFLSKDSNPYRLKLLKELASKDYFDLKADIIEEHLECSMQYKEKFPEKIFSKYILTPRISYENITSYRRFIQQYFTEDEKKSFIEKPLRIWDYINRNMTYSTERDYNLLITSPVGSLKLKMINEVSRKVLFVAICRTLGIPARLNPVDNLPQYYDDGKFISVIIREESSLKKATLNLEIRKGLNWSYNQTWTISRLEKGIYMTLDYSEEKWQNSRAELCLVAGNYRIITANRTPQGDILAAEYYFYLMEEEETKNITLHLNENNQEVAIIEMILPDISLEDKEGKQWSLEAAAHGSKNVFIWLEEGKEPTEHILNEILEQQEEIHRWEENFKLIVKGEKAFENRTISKVLEQMSGITTYREDFNKDIDKLAKFLHTETDKLPYVIVIDDRNQAIYTSSGYNVGSVKQILKSIR